MTDSNPVFRAQVALWVRYLDYLTTHTSILPIQRGFAPGFVNDKKGCTRLTAASDKFYQLLPHGRWFSLGTPASSTAKTGCHDIAEILLKVVLNQIKSNLILFTGSPEREVIMLKNQCIYASHLNIFIFVFHVYPSTKIKYRIVHCIAIVINFITMNHDLNTINE